MSVSSFNSVHNYEQNTPWKVVLRVHGKQDDFRLPDIYSYNRVLSATQAYLHLYHLTLNVDVESWSTNYDDNREMNKTQRSLVFVISVLLKVTEIKSSHQYASLEEIRFLFCMAKRRSSNNFLLKITNQESGQFEKSRHRWSLCSFWSSKIAFPVGAVWRCGHIGSLVWASPSKK